MPIIFVARVLVNSIPLLGFSIRICLLQRSLRICERIGIIQCAISICHTQCSSSFGCLLGLVQPHVGPIMPIIFVARVLVNSIPLLGFSICICLLQRSLRICERIGILKCFIWIFSAQRSLRGVLLISILDRLKQFCTLLCSLRGVAGVRVRITLIGSTIP